MNNKRVLSFEEVVFLMSAEIEHLGNIFAGDLVNCFSMGRNREFGYLISKEAHDVLYKVYDSLNGDCMALDLYKACIGVLGSESESEEVVLKSIYKNFGYVGKYLDKDLDYNYIKEFNEKFKEE